MRTLAVMEPPTRRTSPDADAALTEVYDAHWVSLVRLAWLLLRDQSRAEEVVQDAFIATYPRIAELRATGGAVAYLRRSVVNGCRSVQRRQGVERRYLRRHLESVDLPGRRADASAESGALDHDAHAHMVAALQQLPRRQREVLVLRYYLDLSEAQIADALAISPGAVKSHASRGLATLRTLVEGRG